MTIRLAELAEKINADIQGDGDEVISSVATLENAESGQISYIAEKKYLPLLKKTRASAIILSKAVANQYPGNALITDNPRRGFAVIAQLLATDSDLANGIHETAVVDKTAVLGEAVSVGAHCVIGANVTIGKGTRIYPNVTVLAEAQIGSMCIIHAGAIVGADGFGYAQEDNEWIKVPQVGSVRIGDNVEIGANTTIDRGALDDTIIGNGVKLDNLIQVAHNVSIGDHTAIAACTGIAGSTRIGKRCTIGGQATILGHLEIVDDVHINASTLVTSSIEKAGAYSSSIPATDARNWNRNVARLLKLDQFIKKFKKS